MKKNGLKNKGKEMENEEQRNQIIKSKISGK